MPVTKSPLRYPGGKTQLYNFTKDILNLNGINGTYIEPYSGGFGIGIELLLNGDVERVIINDYDKSIYSLWYSIINNTDKLIDLIDKTPISMESWYQQKEMHHKYKKYRNSIENGFSTLFLNRTNRNGIISAGPIGGYDQSGTDLLDCRFNKEKIIRKILAISTEKQRISLYQKDAVKLINDVVKKKCCSDNTFIFFDPPYYKQGKHLYTNFYKHNDHKSLAKEISELKDYYWILTYDTAPQIYELYSDYEINRYSYQLNYSAQVKRKATEFMFGSELTQLVSQHKVELSLLN